MHRNSTVSSRNKEGKYVLGVEENFIAEWENRCKGTKTANRHMVLSGCRMLGVTSEEAPFFLINLEKWAETTS